MLERQRVLELVWQGLMELPVCQPLVWPVSVWPVQQGQRP